MDLERDPAVRPVPARRQARTDVDEADPEPRVRFETEMVGAPDEMDERMVRGEQACDDLVRPVDLEEESPDLPGRLRPEAERFGDA